MLQVEVKLHAGAMRLQLRPGDFFAAVHVGTFVGLDVDAPDACETNFNPFLTTVFSLIH